MLRTVFTSGFLNKKIKLLYLALLVCQKFSETFDRPLDSRALPIAFPSTLPLIATTHVLICNLKGPKKKQSIQQNQIKWKKTIKELFQESSSNSPECVSQHSAFILQKSMNFATTTKSPFVKAKANTSVI